MFRFGPFRGSNAPAQRRDVSIRDTDTGRRRRDGRLDWFDYAKGICIILVVMLHSTIGTGEAYRDWGLAPQGFMHTVVAYAKPFRMPDFFMLSGLFLSYAIGRGWLHYLDKKLVHFAYFYLLWTTIQVVVRTGATSGLEPGGLSGQLLDALVNPYPTLWFIYVLPLFFILTKAMHGTVPGWLMLAGAALLQILPVNTGWKVIDSMGAHYYVYFLAGYLLAPRIFALARWAEENSGRALAMVACWAMLNGIMVFTPSPIEGWTSLAALPVVSLALGGLGAVAMIMIASLMAKADVLGIIRYCGKHSLVLYVSFTIPMATTRVLLLKTGLVADTGLASVIVGLAALAGPLALYLMVRSTPLRFLYERPDWLVLPYRRPAMAQPT